MIEVRDLVKKYGENEAVKGVSFQVRKGEIYGLLGPNGAGKSTIISVLCGLIQPTSGSVFIDGLNIFTERMRVKKILGVVPQETAFYRELSAYENLMFYGSLYGLRGDKLKERVREAIELVGLEHRMNEPVEKYSGGMLRRLNFACGIVHNPKVLLLDEPTVGIDPQTRLNILEMIAKSAALGATILFTTHYLYEAEQICHRVGIIDNGKLLIEGTISELRVMTAEKDIVIVKGDIKADMLQRKLTEYNLTGVEIISIGANDATLASPSGENNIALLFRALSKMTEIKEFNVKQAGLETLFIKLTGKELREN